MMQRLFHLDRKFPENKASYVKQSCYAGLAMIVSLFFFDVVRQPVIIASFGASAFIAFTAPHKLRSNARHLIGGYIMGIVTGAMLHWITEIPHESYYVVKGLHLFAGALAVALSMFLMAITDTEHPPAASIALGLVINDWTWKTIVLVLLGISLIAVIKNLLKDRMIDLLETGDREAAAGGF